MSKVTPRVTQSSRPPRPVLNNRLRQVTWTAADGALLRQRRLRKRLSQNALAILVFTSQLPELIGVPWLVYPLTVLALGIVLLLPRLTTAVPSDPTFAARSGF